MSIEQICPLCKSAAVYEVNHDPYCKHFYCPTCIEFCIRPEVEHFISSTTDELRGKASEQAQRSNATGLFILREPTAVELADDPKAIVKGEFVARSGPLN